MGRRYIDWRKGWDELGFHDQAAIIRRLPQSQRDLPDANEIARAAWEAHRYEKLLFKEVYAEYLKSSEWKAKRDAVLRRDDHRCRFCGASATEVHHLTYDRKYNEPLYDLVSICSECHKAVHVLKWCNDD